MIDRIGAAVRELQSVVTGKNFPLAPWIARAESSVKELLVKHRPIWLWKYREWRGEGLFEEELKYLALFTDKNKAAADIGASEGWVTYYLLAVSKFVYAFEPQPALAEKLARELPASSVRVEQVALSDAPGTAELRVPSAHQRATIEASNTLEDAGEERTFRVPLRTFDSFGLENLGFVKVDVEGHELAVLRGARETLQRCRPALLIEVEERHRAGAVESVRAFLAELGYRGYFFLSGRLQPIESFDVAAHQDPKNVDGPRKLGVYANNFLFVLPEHESRIRALGR